MEQSAAQRHISDCLKLVFSQIVMELTGITNGCVITVPCRAIEAGLLCVTLTVARLLTNYLLTNYN